MKAARGQRFSRPAPPRELAELRARLAEAEETLRAIGRGEVDAVVVADKRGDRVFTLEGAEHAYRVLIESMNEGALTLTADAVILYANRCFARMVQAPLERVTGSSFRRFLSAADWTTLRPLLKRGGRAGLKIQGRLQAGDGSHRPVQISLRPMAGNGFSRATIGLVVTDLTEARRAEELLRSLTHRVVQAQEVEREHVARELHDNITQFLCASVFRSQALAENLSARDGPLKGDATQLREMLGRAAKEVERITRDLWPSVLDQLGLVTVLRSASKEFADRTGVPVRLARVRLAGRLPAGTELALYRILQEALKNVEQHARARHVAVGLRRQSDFVQLTIHDDGIGFNPAKRQGRGGLGLLGMRERATYAGGALRVESVRHAGTKIEARIPCGGWLGSEETRAFHRE